MGFRYTDEQLAFLRRGYLRWQVPVLTAALNLQFNQSRTEGQIKSALKNHRFICGRGTGGKGWKKRLFSFEQVQFIKENCAKFSHRGMAEELNQRFGLCLKAEQVKNFYANQRIDSGRTGFFEKGSKPWNTGTKGFTSANKTSFKKGSIPSNLKSVGHERVCPKDGYILIKVDQKNPYTGHQGWYRGKHVVVWEQVNGPVPDGMALFFLDGDKTNCALENLELVSRAELLYLNQYGYADLPAELKPSMLATAKLATKTFSLVKEKVA